MKFLNAVSTKPWEVMGYFTIFWFFLDISIIVIDPKVKRDKWLSIIHSIIITCFVLINNNLPVNLYSSTNIIDYNSITCATLIFIPNNSYALGILFTCSYLLYDLFHNHKEFDKSMKIHHISNIISLLTGALSGIGQYILFHCLLNEVSTIFLNLMYLTRRGKIANKISTGLFVITFFLVRIILLSWLYWNILSCLTWNFPPIGLFLIFLYTIHYSVNLYWGYLIWRKLNNCNRRHLHLS